MEKFTPDVKSGWGRLVKSVRWLLWDRPLVLILIGYVIQLYITWNPGAVIQELAFLGLGIYALARVSFIETSEAQKKKKELLSQVGEIGVREQAYREVVSEFEKQKNNGDIGKVWQKFKDVAPVLGGSLISLPTIDFKGK